MVVFSYGFLRINRTMAIPTAMIAISRAADMGRKYTSAMEGACVGCGVGVAGWGSTAKEVTAFEGQ